MVLFTYLSGPLQYLLDIDVVFGKNYKKYICLKSYLSKHNSFDKSSFVKYNLQIQIDVNINYI